MSDKSPRKAVGRKPAGRTLKEKRAAKKAKKVNIVSPILNLGH
jgi:hypothetical protein